MQITRGRIVDYRPLPGQRLTVSGDEVWSAIVTAVEPEVVWLTAFPPGMPPLPVFAELQPAIEPGRWTWPQRV